MAHCLILGMTESGKSTFARQLVSEYAKPKGGAMPSLVLDPLGDPNWNKCGAKYVTKDPLKFLKVVFDSRRCAIFCDEAGETIGRYSKEMMALGTRARHYGHNVHFLAQRAVMIDKNIRDQCSTLVCFRVSRGDAQTLCDEYGWDELLQAHLLEKGEFIQCGRFQKPRRIRLF